MIEHHIKHDFEQLIMRLYKSAYPSVARYVSKMGGCADDARDVFQDALVIFYEKHAAGAPQVQKDKAYLMGIAKHLWLKKFRDGRYQVSLDDLDSDLNLSDEPETVVSMNKLSELLQTAGKKCMDILSAFYYHKRSMKEVSEQLGFAGERSATVQKYKCLEKVRDTVKQNALTYEDLID